MIAGQIHVSVAKSPLLITFSDASGNVLLADEPSLPMAWDGPRVQVWKKMPPDENYYGLGDKAGPMNRRNRAFTNWNTDEFGWQESSDPLYKTIPFFIGLRKGVAYGLFFDNTYRSVFDFGQATAPKAEIEKVKPVVPSKWAKGVMSLPVKPPDPAPPPPPPPPPPIPLKFYGFTAYRQGVKRAFFMEGDDIYVAGEGDTIKNRYKIIRIGVNSAVVEDTQFKHEQTIPLAEEAAQQS